MFGQSSKLLQGNVCLGRQTEVQTPAPGRNNPLHQYSMGLQPVLGKLFWVTLFEQGVGPDGFQRSFPNPDIL